MGTELHLPELRRLLVDFHMLTGQRIGIFDSDFRLIMEYPKQHGAFCTLIRSTADGRRRCEDCDLKGMREARRRGKSYSYRCHAGLMEVCTPVLDGDEAAGYLVFGQLLYAERQDRQGAFCKARCAGLVGSMPLLEEALGGVTTISEGYLDACIHIIEACVGYIRLEQWMRVHRGGLYAQIQAYIAGHIAQPFTLADMAHDLSCSVATLCKTARENTGKTIGRLTLEARLEAAKTYLEDTDRTVAQAAAAAGIADYNYFSRIFRRETGMTPTAYRRSLLAYPQKG